LIVGLQVSAIIRCSRRNVHCSSSEDRVRYIVSPSFASPDAQAEPLASSSPGVVVANVHSIGASLLVWLASGLLAWTGASSFAELGSAIPQNGGAQAYLAYAYGPLVSYLFAWTAIIALKPGVYPNFLISIFKSHEKLGGNAVISLIFAEYMNRIFWNHTQEDVSPDSIPQWAIKLVAVGSVVIVTILCVAAAKLGTRVAVVFTSLKVIALVSTTLVSHGWSMNLA
jgi:amino acid transporter